MERDDANDDDAHVEVAHRVVDVFRDAVGPPRWLRFAVAASTSLSQGDEAAPHHAFFDRVSG